MDAAWPISKLASWMTTFGLGFLLVGALRSYSSFPRSAWERRRK
jgi:hypothetical protein